MVTGEARHNQDTTTVLSSLCQMNSHFHVPERLSRKVALGKLPSHRGECENRYYWECYTVARDSLSMPAQNKHTHFFLPSFPSLPPLPSFFHRLNPEPMRVKPVCYSATHPGSLFSSYLRSRSFCVRICSKHRPHADCAMLVPSGCSWWKHLFTLLHHLFHLLMTLRPVTGVLGSPLCNSLTQWLLQCSSCHPDAPGSIYGGITQQVVFSFMCVFFLSLHTSQALS